MGENRHRLRQIVRRFRGRLKRMSLRKTTVLAVTGSCGKTTTTAFLGKILSDHDNGFVGIHENDENSVMRNLNCVRQSDRFFLQEVSGDTPGIMARNVKVLRPEIGIVTTIGQDHYRNFRTLDATAKEKGTLIEALPECGVAVLNADDPHVVAMAQRAKAKVLTYGVSDGADVRATDIEANWPRRLSMTITYQGERVRLETNLFGDLLIPSVLGAVAGALAVGIDLSQCVRSLTSVESFPRRMSIHQSPRGAWFINDAGKAPFWGVPKVLSLMENVTAPRTTMVFGTFSDVRGADSDKYRQMARDALKVVDRVLFVGPKAFYIRKRITPELEERLLMMESAQDVARYLSEDVVRDELVFIKSGNRDHLERLIYGQFGELSCWKQNCPKMMSCHQCAESGVPVDRGAVDNKNCTCYFKFRPFSRLRLIILGPIYRQIERPVRQSARRVRLYLRGVRRDLGRFWRRFFGRRIPLAMITGTKGKTTTIRMLAHILTTVGHRVGFTCTDGVVIAGEYLRHGDSAGYHDARTVLRHKNITAAILEVARGGLLKTGPYMDRCDVAALLNVGREQIGMDGVDTVEQMAAVKQRVIHAAKGAVVLNADDEQCVRLIGDYPARQVMLFSLVEDNAVVKKHVETGGIAFQRRASLAEDCIVRCEGDSVESLIPVAQLPSCRNGLFPQNIANAMAAAALAEGLAIPQKDIQRGLGTFENSIEQSPGKLNFIDGYSQTILIDNAAQPPACEMLTESLEKLSVPGKRVCMVYTVGNRPDWHYVEMTAALAPHFDHFICYELECCRRGRAPGEISNLLAAGLMKAGVLQCNIDLEQGYEEATRKLSQIAGRGDLLVILMASIHQYLPVFRENFSSHRQESKEESSCVLGKQPAPVF